MGGACAKRNAGAAKIESIEAAEARGDFMRASVAYRARSRQLGVERALVSLAQSGIIVADVAHSWIDRIELPKSLNYPPR